MKREIHKPVSPIRWPQVRGPKLNFMLTCRSYDELVRSLTPYERDCMWKVNLAQCHGEPVDPHAQRVWEEAVRRFEEQWKRTVLARWRQVPTIEQIVEETNREPMTWPSVRLRKQQ